MRSVFRRILPAMCLGCMLFLATGCESRAERETREKAEQAMTTKIVGGVAIVVGLLAGIGIGSARRNTTNAQQRKQ